MNLIEMRARVRQDLQDEDSNDYRWSDDQIDAAIERTVMEYSLYAPIQCQDDIDTTPADNELDISGLQGLLQIESLQFPIGYYQLYQHWAGRLFMKDNGTGDKARVRWRKKHTITDTSTTIPPEHDEIIVLGATGYLAMSASVNTVDRAFIAGRCGTISYREWARERLSRYEQQLKRLAQASRITQKELYTEE
jgi:hypothetical protein